MCPSLSTHVPCLVGSSEAQWTRPVSRGTPGLGCQGLRLPILPLLPSPSWARAKAVTPLSVTRRVAADVEQAESGEDTA